MLTDTVTIIAQLPLVDAAPTTTTPPAALPQARPITFGVGDRVTILAGGFAGYTGTIRACRPVRGTVTLTTDSGLILVGYRADLLAPVGQSVTP